MDEEEIAKKRKRYEIGQELSDISVDELEELVAMLEAEIARLEEAKASKSSHLSAAEALFNTKT